MSTPLLLNAPKQMVRDAARAAKRKIGLMVQRVTSGTLSTLLGLPGMVITDYALEQPFEEQSEREVLHIFCEHEHEVAVCPDCGQVTQKVHDRKAQSIRHLDIWGKRTFVHFPSRRFDCERCEKSFREELSWIESQRRESTAYEWRKCFEPTVRCLEMKFQAHSGSRLQADR